ncbi:MAG: hypothetical protein V9G20_31300 [Candidatus Promineifilaceae bacterium]
MLMNLMRRSGWFVSLLVFSMPITLIIFLGVVMAYFQVRSEFDVYQHIQEYTTLAELASVSETEVVMLHGRLIAGPETPWADGLVIFQERPLDGREVRFQEEFPLVFPEITLELSDGTLLVQPGVEQVINHEPQRVVDEAADREYTGFRIGDMITVQGQWQPSLATLTNVTGVSGLDRAGIIAEGSYAFKRLSTIRNVLGGITLLGVISLVGQLLRARGNEPLVPQEVG